MFGIIRSLKRRKWKKLPVPEQWYLHLKTHVPFYQALKGQERSRFLEQLKLFVWEKYFVGAGGMEITDEVRVVISACAVRLVQHLDLNYYNNLTEIVVYPGDYVHPDGGEGIILGEAHTWGTVVLSWASVLSGLKNQMDGHDTATHEFAHVLDIENGSFNGTPTLRRRDDYAPWAEVLQARFDDLRMRRKKERRVLRDYGATNAAEFFAVATESFFEKPNQMKEHTPDLYAEMREFYGWDPAGGDTGNIS